MYVASSSITTAPLVAEANKMASVITALTAPKPAKADPNLLVCVLRSRLLTLLSSVAVKASLTSIILKLMLMALR